MWVGGVCVCDEQATIEHKDWKLHIYLMQCMDRNVVD